MSDDKGVFVSLTIEDGEIVKIAYPKETVWFEGSFNLKEELYTVHIMPKEDKPG